MQFHQDRNSSLTVCCGTRQNWQRIGSSPDDTDESSDLLHTHLALTGKRVHCYYHYYYRRQRWLTSLHASSVCGHYRTSGSDPVADWTSHRIRPTTAADICTHRHSPGIFNAVFSNAFMACTSTYRWHCAESPAMKICWNKVTSVMIRECVGSRHCYQAWRWHKLGHLKVGKPWPLHFLQI